MARIFAFSLLVLSALVSVHCEDETPIEIDNQIGLREGDMKFSNARAFGLFDNSQQKWPGGIVPYEIITSGYSASQINTIRQGLDLLSTKTDECIKPVQKNSTHRNWIQIFSGSGCWSYVGRFREGAGAQKLSLQAAGCTYLGTVVHEFMHAIGFWHEQNRPDRDDYIRVDLGNVDEEYKSNFDKYTGNQRQTFTRPYDLRSIMQYYEYSFSNNGRKTIIPLDSTITLVAVYRKSANQILTTNDVLSVKDLYQCAAVNPGVTYPPTNPEPEVILPEGSQFTFILKNNSRRTVSLYWRRNSSERWNWLANVRNRREVTQRTYVGTEFAVVGRAIRTTFFIAGRGDLTSNNDEVHVG